MGEALDARAAAALGEIRSRLARARERWRLVEIAERLLFWTAVLAGVILVTSTIEVLLRPGLIVRLVLFAALVGTAGATLVRERRSCAGSRGRSFAPSARRRSPGASSGRSRTSATRSSTQ
ncbi:MAG: hypothetical protein ACYTFI_28515 [Planctomycetota bacterium]